MRIISGKYKGLALPKGLPSKVRPTTDATREAIFNIISNYIEFDGCKVADAFAGSGALGFEALSRGAGYCSFIEISRNIADYIEKTAMSFRLKTEEYHVYQSDAMAFFSTAGNRTIPERFDLVFADPPYKSLILNRLLRLLQESGMLAPGALIVLEHGQGEVIGKSDRFELLTSRVYGTTVVDFLRFNV